MRCPVEQNELFRLFDGKRFEHHRIDQAEDSRVGADSQRQRKDDNGR